MKQFPVHVPIKNTIDGIMDISLRVEEALIQVAKTCSSYDDFVAPLIEGANANYQDLYGKTALMYILENNTIHPTEKSKIIDKLIQAGANLETKSNSGKTALMYLLGNERARLTTKYQLIEKLIGAGAELETKDKEGNTALARAFNEDMRAEVIFLLKAGADPNCINSKGTPLVQEALNHGYIDTLELFHQKGANFDIPDKNGYTALMLATLMEEPGIVKKIINFGANLEIQEKDGKTALLLAAEYSDIKTLEVLLKAGASQNLRGLENDSNLLTYIISKGQNEKALLLLKYSKDISSTNLNHDTALHVAITKGSTEVCKELILRMTLEQLNYIKPDGTSYLNLIKESKPELEEFFNERKYNLIFEKQKNSLLVDHYPSLIHTVDKFHETPLHKAIKKRFFESSQLMINKMTLQQLNYIKPDGTSYIDLIKEFMPELEDVINRRKAELELEKSRTTEHSTRDHTSTASTLEHEATPRLNTGTAVVAGAGAGAGAGASAGAGAAAGVVGPASRSTSYEAPNGRTHGTNSSDEINLKNIARKARLDLLMRHDISFSKAPDRTDGTIAPTTPVSPKKSQGPRGVTPGGG